MLKLKVPQIYPTVVQKVATVVFTEKLCLSKKTQRSPNMLATFVRKCVTESFQISPNLVTLVIAFFTLLDPSLKGDVFPLKMAFESRASATCSSLGSIYNQVHFEDQHRLKEGVRWLSGNFYHNRGGIQIWPLVIFDPFT